MNVLWQITVYILKKYKTQNEKLTNLEEIKHKWRIAYLVQKIMLKGGVLTNGCDKYKW